MDGDARSAVIAAASVVAKVTRDRYMLRLARGAAGLALPHERGLLDSRAPCRDPEQGISDLHRRSFQSVAYQQLAIKTLLIRTHPRGARARP